MHPPAHQPLPSHTEHKCLLNTCIPLALLLIFLPSASSKELCSVLDWQSWAIRVAKRIPGHGLTLEMASVKLSKYSKCIYEADLASS